MHFDAEFWVAVAFLIFLGILWKVGAHKQALAALDHRGQRIKADLDDAKRLRDEAQALLAEYQRKRYDAEREADAIIANAKVEAERMASESKAKLEEFVARRTKMAQDKIAQAEAQALADVRAAAAEAAVSAAGVVLSASVKGDAAQALITRGVGGLKAKLN
jgi:F-type H+-transporting ATPase subunit b